MVVLATLVLIELRSIRPILAGVREVLTALLERERIRAERKREPSAPPPSLQEFAEEPSTDLHDIIDRQRRERERGLRPPRKGTHAD